MTLLKNINKIFFVAFFISAIVSDDYFAQPANLFSPANRYKFANYLFHQQDYFRSNDEFRQYLRFANNDTVRFKIAYGLLEIGELNQSKDYLKSLFVNSNLSDEAKILFFKIKFLENNVDEMESAVSNKIFFSDKYSTNISKLHSSLKLLNSKEVLNSAGILKPFKGEEADTIRQFFIAKYNPDLKSEFLAGIMSAIIPGMGKIYTENYSDGITSFLFTTILGYLSYNNFQNDHNNRGWIFAGLTSFFYAGNIYGSIASANIYNTKIALRVNLDITDFVKKHDYFMPKMKRIIE